jgi:hypothetical protein
VKRFLEIVETHPFPFAIHCKAGMGRTGTLIGLFLIKKYNMKPEEALAWMRMCRVGMVDPLQQEFLVKRYKSNSLHDTSSNTTTHTLPKQTTSSIIRIENGYGVQSSNPPSPQISSATNRDIKVALFNAALPQDLTSSQPNLKQADNSSKHVFGSGKISNYFKR